MNNLVHALNEYNSTANSSIAFDNPHQLILRLFNGAIERIAQAKGAIQQNNPQIKGEMISKTIGIINGLDSCLDHEQGSELSANLSALYEYSIMRLLEANVENDGNKLDEVSGLINEIRSAWKQIPDLTQE